MKRIVSLVCAVILSLFLASRAEAQLMGAPEGWKGKMVVGCDLGAGFFGNGFHFGIAPQAGYRLTRSLEVGARLSYDMYHYYNYSYGSYFCHYFSGSVYANMEIFRGVFIHVEDEEMCELVSGKALNATSPQWFNSVFAGAGYRQYYTRNDFGYFAILYNFSWDYYITGNYGCPYNSPYVIRIGYCHGF